MYLQASGDPARLAVELLGYDNTYHLVQGVCCLSEIVKEDRYHTTYCAPAQLQRDRFTCQGTSMFFGDGAVTWASRANLNPHSLRSESDRSGLVVQICG